MSVVGLASVRGGPGVTTASLLLAGAMSGSVLVEADPSGGALAARYGLGREPGLTTLLARARSGSQFDWREHAQSACGVPVIVGPDAPEAAHLLWQQSDSRATQLVRSMEVPVVADLGRLGSQVPLAGALDVLLLVVRGTREHLVTASHRVAALRAAVGSLGIVVVGNGPYGAAEVGESLAADVLAVLPDDPAAAAMLEGRGTARSLARTRLVRASHALAEVVEGAARAATALGAIR